jgi:Fe-S cluster biosynthesis and repair protein YggX
MEWAHQFTRRVQATEKWNSIPPLQYRPYQGICLILRILAVYLKGFVPMARTVQCIKLGKAADGLDFPPYPGELGKRIWEGVSKEAWADWLKHQTMLVNENRLNLADLRARQYLARQMEKHFFGEGADEAQGYVPPPSA